MFWGLIKGKKEAKEIEIVKEKEQVQVQEEVQEQVQEVQEEVQEQVQEVQEEVQVQQEEVTSYLEGPLYENRELSWLRFNQRVLEEAQNQEVPLCERLSFLSIFQTNLDEFYMVRVGSLEDQKLLQDASRENKTNMTPGEQIDAIGKRVKELSRSKDETYHTVMESVAKEGVKIVSFSYIDKDNEETLKAYFIHEIKPLLSAMIVGRKQPFPFLKGADIHAFAILDKDKKDQKKNKESKEKIGIVTCSSDVFPRLIHVPQTENTYVLSEELILHFLPVIFKGFAIREKTLLRITRNADIDVKKVYDEDLNYRDQMAEVVKQRRKLAPVRIEISRDISQESINKLCKYCKISKKQVFKVSSPLDLSFVFTVADMLRMKPELSYPKRIPQPSPSIDMNRPVIDQILEKDILLSYPYESIKPFLQLLQQAANDPKVISIRMTLYRLAKNSKIVEALVDAAENGKQVDVLVELKARFDEANNIGWSRTLEEAGCHVVYGLDGLKVHSKILLITRKDEDQIEYITQIGTGNYNEKTSRLYTDLSLMTANQEIGEEVSNIFHSLFLGQTVEETNCLMVAPNCLQNKIIDKINHEIFEAREGRDAYIGVKINSLTDKKIIDKLIEASQAGVKIDMMIRGINCLRSGVKGKTENIHVYSIVGRFLEHSRIYIFGCPSREQIYIASADFMTRNTLRRVEVATPIYDEQIKQRIHEIFNIMISDNVKKRVQQLDGSYVIEPSDESPLNAQEYFFEQAYQNAK